MSNIIPFSRIPRQKSFCEAVLERARRAAADHAVIEMHTVDLRVTRYEAYDLDTELIITAKIWTRQQEKEPL